MSDNCFYSRINKSELLSLQQAQEIAELNGPSEFNKWSADAWELSGNPPDQIYRVTFWFEELVTLNPKAPCLKHYKTGDRIRISDGLFEILCKGLEYAFVRVLDGSPYRVGAEITYPLDVKCQLEKKRDSL